MTIEFELYKDRAVVKIKDDDGKTVEQYESAKAHIKDKHWLTKAQADARNNPTATLRKLGNG